MTSAPAASNRRKPALAGSALGLVAALPAGAALAQPAATPVTGVEVTAPEAPDYKVDTVSISKLTQPMVDTPQQIESISRQLMDDRGVTTLNDALRNASGVSLGAGESSWQGTNLTLRGFNARNDMYLDGMRDFGSYYRDPFNLEQVQVLEGPSSVLFGRGSTGGVINQVSKTPTLGGHTTLEAAVGTDDTHRGTIDFDAPLPELGQGAAVRVNLMAHENNIAGFSDIPHFFRWGVAPSLALGLGTPTRLDLSYFHQSEDDVPTLGIPWHTVSPTLSVPAPVPRSNFYGFSSDFLHTTADAWTAKVEHDYNANLTVSDQLRYAQYFHSWRQMEPQPVAAPAGTPLSSILVNRALQGSNSHETFLQNQLDVEAKFSTGMFKHNLVFGSEVGPESSKPEYDNALGVPQTLLLTPNENQVFSGNVFPRIITDTKAFSYAFYAIDTIELTKNLLLTGGIRWDSFQNDYTSTTYSNTPGKLGTPIANQPVVDNRTDQAPSYRGSIVYKPTGNGSVYFDYSTSFNPSAEALSEVVAVRSLNMGNLYLDPEKNQTFEAGTKWQVLDDHVLLQAAVFREEKYNARVPSAITGLNMLGGNFRVDGFELQGSGHLTDAWQVNASYTYLHTQVIKSAPGGPTLGAPLFNAPDSSGNIWTSYAFTKQFEAGVGVTYMGQRYGSNTAPLYEIAPAYTTVDAMLRYRINNHLRAQVNIYNIGDVNYADALHGFHVIPGAGRSALFSLAADF
jgi:catecholate siderophore receptor